METKLTSALGRLDKNDFLKSGALTIIVAVLDFIKTSYTAGGLHIDWNELGTVAIMAGVGYLLKNLGTASMTIVKALVLIVGMSTLCGTSVHAQSMFSRLPPPASRQHFLSMQVFGDSVLPPLAAPTMKAFRFVTNVLTYSEPGHVLMGGAGAAYQWLRMDATTQKWYSDYSINVLMYGGAGVSPPNAAAVAAGLSLGFLNNLITVGGAYNFETKKFGPTLGININLNN